MSYIDSFQCLSHFKVFSFASAQPALFSWLLFMVVFHSLGIMFYYFDKVDLFPRHKQFRGSSSTPTYSQMLPLVLFNQILILLPAMLISEHYSLIFVPNPNAAPFLPSFIFISIAIPQLHEIFFYIFHRYILHSSFGYYFFNHKVHHDSRTHCSISAMYMSPPDFILEILLPYLFPLYLTAKLKYCPPLVCVVVLPFGGLGGLYEHSGYNFFPNIKVLDTTVHGQHHRMWNCSFADGVGTTSLMDSTFGTVCGGGSGLFKGTIEGAAYVLKAMGEATCKLWVITMKQSNARAVSKSRVRSS